MRSSPAPKRVFIFGITASVSAGQRATPVSSRRYQSSFSCFVNEHQATINLGTAQEATSQLPARGMCLHLSNKMAANTPPNPRPAYHLRRRKGGRASKRRCETSKPAGHHEVAPPPPHTASQELCFSRGAPHTRARGQRHSLQGAAKDTSNEESVAGSPFATYTTSVVTMRAACSSLLGTLAFRPGIASSTILMVSHPSSPRKGPPVHPQLRILLRVFERGGVA